MLICSHKLSLSLEKLCMYFLACLEQDNHLQNSYELYDRILNFHKIHIVQLELTYSSLYRLKIYQ